MRLIVRVGDAGVEFSWTRPGSAHDDVVQVDRGRMSALIGQVETIVARGVLLFDEFHPILRFVVVVQELGRLLRIQGGRDSRLGRATAAGLQQDEGSKAY